MGSRSVIERAARAVGDTVSALPSAENNLDVARAVLQAIREPSEEMMKAGDAAAWQGSDLNDGQPVIRNVFPAMIDAALEEG